MKTLIKNGLVIDPMNHVQSRLNLLLADGKVAAVTSGEPEADQVVDATGKIVTPGFIDIHMHEDPVGPRRQTGKDRGYRYFQLHAPHGSHHRHRRSVWSQSV